MGHIKTFLIDGRSYAYHLYENGVRTETLVFFHGFTGTMHTWDDMASVLAAHYRIITIDLPGHGKTIGADCVDMKQFADDFVQLMEVEDIAQAIFLGYSMGGRTALSFARYYPEKVSQLILESASPGLADETEQQKRMQADEQLAVKIEREGMESFVNFWKNIPLFASQKRLSQSVQAQVRSERLAQREAGLAGSLRHMGTGVQEAWWDELKEIHIPVLLVTGALDEKFVRINEQMKEAMLKAQHISIDKAGHAVHIEKAEAFLQVVTQFLQKDISIRFNPNS